MQFTDAVTVAGTRRTADGYLVAEAKCVRTGIQLYLGDEVGRPEMQQVRVYRGPDEVFADASLQSFTHAPVTINHPKDQVTADNWKNLAVGEVSTMAKKDGEWVLLPLILKDAKGITEVESGKRQLSAGYTCELVWEPGVTADGAPYDARQTNIKINHLAIVDTARAGSQARIGDDAGKWGASPVKTQTADERNIQMDLRKVLVDGLQVETTDAGAQAIEKLTKALADAKATADTTIQVKDGKIADLTKAVETKDGEIAALKKQVEDGKLKPADLAKLVKDRALLVADAKKAGVDEKDMDDLTEEEIKRKAVAKKMGDDAAKAMSADAINGAFAVVTKTSGSATDPLRTALGDGVAANDGGSWADGVFASAGVKMKKGA